MIRKCVRTQTCLEPTPLGACSEFTLRPPAQLRINYMLVIIPLFQRRCDILYTASGSKARCRVVASAPNRLVWLYSARIKSLRAAQCHTDALRLFMNMSLCQRQRFRSNSVWGAWNPFTHLTAHWFNRCFVCVDQSQVIKKSLRCIRKSTPASRTICARGRRPPSSRFRRHASATAKRCAVWPYTTRTKPTGRRPSKPDWTSSVSTTCF